jgi:hypothetical protein
MKKVRLQTPCSGDTKLVIIDNRFPFEKKRIKIISAYDEGNEDVFAPQTLRDVAIVMESMVGSGVMKQLAIEISSEIPNISPQTAINALVKIFRTYYKMSEEEANKKWDELENWKDLEDE